MADKKKLPKAPPMSPVRSLAKLSDSEFNKLQKAVEKSAGMTVGKANYPGKKKPKEGPMYDPRTTTVKSKKKTTKKKSGGSVGTHNRLY